MVVLSFSVLKEKVLNGQKSRTMRAVAINGKENKKWFRTYNKFLNLQETNRLNAKHVFIGGDYYKYKVVDGKKYIPLQIYWKARSPKHEKLFDAILVNIQKKKLGELTEKEWRLDGFENGPVWTHQDAGFEWFSKTYKIPLWNELRLIADPDSEAVYSDEIVNFEVYIVEFQRVK
jgi:hypothetical protein